MAKQNTHNPKPLSGEAKTSSAGEAGGQKKGKGVWLWIILVLLLLVLGLLAVLYRQQIKDYFYPATPSAAEAIKQLEEEEILLLEDSGETAMVPGHHYLVAGTFVFYPYAEQCRDKMLAQGYEAQILSSGEPRQFHRIYIESSEDLEVLRARRDELRSSTGLDLWIYSE
jgi:hypothetical protein